MMFDGYSFSEEESIKKTNTYSEDEVILLLRKDIDLGSAVLYKYISSGRVGVARIQSKFNHIWK